MHLSEMKTLFLFIGILELVNLLTETSFLFLSAGLQGVSLLSHRGVLHHVHSSLLARAFQQRHDSVGLHALGALLIGVLLGQSDLPTSLCDLVHECVLLQLDRLNAVLQRGHLLMGDVEVLL